MTPLESLLFQECNNQIIKSGSVENETNDESQYGNDKYRCSRNLSHTNHGMDMTNTVVPVICHTNDGICHMYNSYLQHLLTHEQRQASVFSFMFAWSFTFDWSSTTKLTMYCHLLYILTREQVLRMSFAAPNTQQLFILRLPSFI